MKILCPFHKDTNPSMHVYDDWCHCFVCGARAKTEDVLDGNAVELVRKEPTNIGEMVEYIKRLPKVPIRGLELPTDNTGYYILWPDNSFYKKRLFEGKTRYVGPRGRKPTLFKIQGNTNTLVLIEGEINALSLATVVQGPTIAAISGVTNIIEYSRLCLQYSRVYVILDKDIPGVIAGLKLKEELFKYKKRVQLIAVENDTNEILQKEGKEGVYKWAKENLDLQAWVQSDK